MTRGFAGAISEAHLEAFREHLTAWFDGARRPMPWRQPGPDGRRDPYRVWLSEVMLQQTRVDQAAPYFERFTAAYPTLRDLAAADLDDVLRLWEGLGYYSRARNLHRAVREVASRYDARVPDSEEDFRALPGVGAYTAAAVLSLAFDTPLAVLDGNVIRVLTRVFAIGDDAGRAATRRHLQDLATALLDPRQPGRFNEALMELGATVCTPRAPDCPACPLASICAARSASAQEDYPVTARKAPVPHHDIAVALIFDDDGRVLVQRRPQDGMLGGLWEFPGGKVRDAEVPATAAVRETREELGVVVAIGAPLARIRHTYSHFRITLHAFEARMESGEPVHHRGEEIRWVRIADLENLAFPRANRRLIEALSARGGNPTLFEPYPAGAPTPQR
jgi:A/G-specific adenine glycosylase